MTKDEIFIGMGGNLGGPEVVLTRFRHAARALHARLGSTRTRVSAVYWTAPVGPVQAQARFLNAALACMPERALAPGSVLELLLALEREHGRDRVHGVPQGPRTLDLDLLFVGAQALDEAGPPRLLLPHPRVSERAFALQPLADLQGLDWDLPGFGQTVGACLEAPAVRAQRAELRPYPDAIGAVP
ncbi:2-amino-4-hydroxy-6-hydroxymethyldihydropteridine diphosphokinase [Haliangium ochraceum]|uniref:2-amino-4-hydroxy-6-hydroxymethyldihydropteridine pyrophosphokinase n=1 Tax=Haliangium ochraceum (strain DSM 14365 / JCM 11303 / SMP-2) TaxID=502025 RepID=D0LUL4_HALO1|nr:2-amino-4-hydroxy-6-hydroxymethyldihydropteridine diphosphokinase [Haliangium ochraceum]ACY19337.1 2-amino-4-hydroxy-6-hydroxymethyldihydropteridin epyrophosphokinase [Haliangium ochraceum DSM 14365]